MTRRPQIILGVLAVFACAAAPGAQSQPPARPVSADFVAPGPVVPLDSPVMSAARRA